MNWTIINGEYNSLAYSKVKQMADKIKANTFGYLEFKTLSSIQLLLFYIERKTKQFRINYNKTKYL